MDESIDFEQLQNSLDEIMIDFFSNGNYANAKELNDSIFEYVVTMMLDRQKLSKSDIDRILNALNDYNLNQQNKIKNAVFINQLKE